MTAPTPKLPHPSEWTREQVAAFEAAHGIRPRSGGTRYPGIKSYPDMTDQERAEFLRVNNLNPANFPRRR